ncbi:hypothetical protein V7S43_011727 [Phytophthora oleae]|uniref:Uncharacterized protein n=1 Tax=Phytophthora oleae TaxID=2107226 RepID=A0ABD3FEA1_9STRA
MFVSKQDAISAVPVDQVSDFPAAQIRSDTLNGAAIDALDGESSTSSDENVRVLSVLKEGATASFNDDVLGLLRDANAATRPKPLQHPAFDDARRSEQGKVAARALNRSRQLADNSKKAIPAESKTSSHKKRGSVLTKAETIQKAVKKRSDERKLLKKQRAVDADKGVEVLEARLGLSGGSSALGVKIGVKTT